VVGGLDNLLLEIADGPFGGNLHFEGGIGNLSPTRELEVIVYKLKLY